MDPNTAKIEERIQAAIIVIDNKEFPSIRKAAQHFQVPRSTSGSRLKGRSTRSQAHKIPTDIDNTRGEDYCTMGETIGVNWILGISCIVERNGSRGVRKSRNTRVTEIYDPYWKSCYWSRVAV